MIILKEKEVLRAIDDYQLTREAISHHFRANGLKASFLPKATKEIGDSLRVRLSLWSEGRNVIGDASAKYGLSPKGGSFMAGVLNNFNALYHFLCPSANSLRCAKLPTQAGSHKYWGIENKEAPIRLLSLDQPNGLATHIEIKAFDHTANLYFALAALIALGVNGLLNNWSLPEPLAVDPSKMTEEERCEQMFCTLPTTHMERRKAIYSEEGIPLRAFFGEDLIENILRGHEYDAKYWAGKDLEDEVKVMIERF